MSKLTVTTLDKTDILLDKLAYKFVNDGLTPEAILSTLKEANYEVNFQSKGRCKVDAITVANIARGVLLARTLTTKPRATRTKTKAIEA